MLSLFSCDAFCHIGNCKPCAVVYREGVPCACGRTHSGRNTKCGTPAPHCPYPCSRPRACDPSHACVQTCHESACAPCVVLVNKMCAGGHKELKSIPCYAQPSCGITCGRLLRCGIHACKRPCHAGKCTVALGSQVGERRGWAISPSAPSAAERKEAEAAAAAAEAEADDGSIRSCNQKCGLRRPDCGHPCSAACHPGDPCPTDVECKEPSRVYCACKRISKVVSCGGGTGGVGVRALECTPQCELETRNAKLRSALQLDDSVPRIPYPSELLEQVIAGDLFEFVVRAERMLAEFLALTSGGSKTFTAMASPHRWVMHQLASYHNMDSESFDPEPRRSVRVIKSPASCLPKMKLSDAVKLWREAKAGKGGLTAAKVALPPATAIHLFDLDQSPRVSPSDLALALKPYALDFNGERNHNFRVNFLDDAHAIIVFSDAQLASNIRANLASRKLFALEPDEAASKKAVDAWRNQYTHNALFRRRHETGGVASIKKLSATTTGAGSAVASSSSFDDWSAARSGTSAKTAEASPPVPSSWDSDVPAGQSDREFEALLERTKQASLADALPSSSASASSSAPAPVSAGVVCLAQPKVVPTHRNAFAGLGDADDEDVEAADSDSDEEEEEDGWSKVSTSTTRQATKAASAAPTVAKSKSAFDD